MAYWESIDAADLARIEAAYRESLGRHIAFVQQAGRQIGVPEELLLVHDESKFSTEEYLPYAVNFYGSDEQKEANRPDYALAWLHHLHANKHHWQHWIVPLGEVLPMPPVYVREMVADWMGASRAYTGSWDMTEWLKEHLPGLVLHDDTEAILLVLLQVIGYRDAVAWRMGIEVETA